MFLNRLAAWVLERFGEAVLLGVLFIVLTWSDETELRDLFLIVFLTGYVFMVGSGYLLTTAIVGVVWRSQRWWLYPSCAVVLFMTHLHFFATGWKGLDIKFQIQAGGACIVFACTSAGNFLLKKWDAPAK